MKKEFPSEGMEITHILVVRDMEKSKVFYRDVIGAELFREYEGSCVLKFLGSWILLVVGGKPTKDKPDVTFEAPKDSKTVSHSITIRVPNCKEAYEILKKRGAKFLTPPVDWGGEIRCFFRDPDSHLLEISQAS